MLVKATVAAVSSPIIIKTAQQRLCAHGYLTLDNIRSKRLAEGKLKYAKIIIIKFAYLVPNRGRSNIIPCLGWCILQYF